MLISLIGESNLRPEYRMLFLMKKFLLIVLTFFMMAACDQSKQDFENY